MTLRRFLYALAHSMEMTMLVFFLIKKCSYLHLKHGFGFEVRKGETEERKKGERKERPKEKNENKT